MGDTAADRRLRGGLDAVSGYRVSQRRSASGCVGTLVAGPKFRVGRRQASAADGMGCAPLDPGFSADGLVVPVAGNDQRRAGVVERRPDRAPVRPRRQAAVVMLLLMLLPAYQ